MFFSYNGDSFEIHETELEARECAEDALDSYRSEAGDGWADESMNVCWGRLSQLVQVTEERPATEDDPVSGGIEIYQERRLVDCSTDNVTGG